MALSEAALKILETMELKLATVMLDKLENGECDAATLNAVRSYLKDHDMTSLPTANENLGKLAKLIGDVPDPDAPLKFEAG